MSVLAGQDYIRCHGATKTCLEAVKEPGSDDNAATHSSHANDWDVIAPYHTRVIESTSTHIRMSCLEHQRERERKRERKEYCSVQVNLYLDRATFLSSRVILTNQRHHISSAIQNGEHLPADRLPRHGHPRRGGVVGCLRPGLLGPSDREGRVCRLYPAVLVSSGERER